MLAPEAHTLPMPAADGSIPPAPFPPTGDTATQPMPQLGSPEVQQGREVVTISPQVWFRARNAVQNIQSFRDPVRERWTGDSLSDRTGITVAEFDALFKPESAADDNKGYYPADETDGNPGISHFDGKPLSAIEKKAILEQLQESGILGFEPDEASGQLSVVWAKKHKPKVEHQYESLEDDLSRRERLRNYGRRAVSESVYMHKRRITSIKKNSKKVVGRGEKPHDGPSPKERATADLERRQAAGSEWARSNRTTQLRLQADPAEQRAMQRKLALWYRLGKEALRLPDRGALIDPEAFDFATAEAANDVDDEYRDLLKNGNIIRLAGQIKAIAHRKVMAGVPPAQARAEAQAEVIDQAAGADDPDKDVPDEVKDILGNAIANYTIFGQPQAPRQSQRQGGSGPRRPNGSTSQGSPTGPGRPSGQSNGNGNGNTGHSRGPGSNSRPRQQRRQNGSTGRPQGSPAPRNSGSGPTPATP